MMMRPAGISTSIRAERTRRWRSGLAQPVSARRNHPAHRAPAAGRAWGVVAREVTLLPRHWDWLERPAGGASVALRKLVEAARRQQRHDQDRRRQARDAAYHFMASMAGDFPGFRGSDPRPVYERSSPFPPPSRGLAGGCARPRPSGSSPRAAIRPRPDGRGGLPHMCGVASPAATFPDGTVPLRAVTPAFVSSADRTPGGKPAVFCLALLACSASA